MSDTVFDKDVIWLASIGRDNEQDRRDLELELPFDEEKLPELLRDVCGVDEEHEEIFMPDYSFDGPLGELGLNRGEGLSMYGDPKDLNAIAELAQQTDPDKYEAVRTFLSLNCCGPNDLAELGNALVQADELYAAHLDDAYPEDVGVGVVAAQLLDVSEEDQEEYFNYESYGRDLVLNGDVWAGRDGFMIEHVIDSVDMADIEEIIEECDLSLNMDFEEAKKLLHDEFGVWESVCDEDERATIAAAELLGELDKHDADAVLTYACHCLSGDYRPEELAAVSQRVNELGYRTFDSWDKDSRNEQVAHMWVDELYDGCAREAVKDAMSYFDYARFGKAMSEEGAIYVEDKTVLLTLDDGPDLNRYDMGGLRELAGLEIAGIDSVQDEATQVSEAQEQGRGDADPGKGEER